MLKVKNHDFGFADSLISDTDVDGSIFKFTSARSANTKTEYKIESQTGSYIHPLPA